MVIELLAIAIRSNPQIHGVVVGNDEHTISLYADDIMLFLTKPESSLPALADLLEAYGSISGYKVNRAKSIIMPLNSFADVMPQLNIPFSWNDTSLTYLGLQISNKLDQTFMLNYGPLLKVVGQELDRWKTLPISLIGRVNCIKMSVLPRFLYLFRTLPCHVPQSFFKHLNSLITTFLWQGKPARIKLKVLCLNPCEGGLGLPDFYLYYLAAQSMVIWAWQTNRHNPPSWRQKKQHQLADITLSSLPYIPYVHTFKRTLNNPFVLQGCIIWSDIRKKTKNLQIIYTGTPFYANPALPEILKDELCLLWYRKGIRVFGDLFDKGSFLSFEQLKLKFSLESKHFFKHLQVRDYIRVQQGGKLLSLYPLELDTFIVGKDIKKFVSTMYKMLLKLSVCGPVGAKLKWEQDLGVDFKEEQWKAICQKSQSFSFNSRHRLQQFNLIHRVYYTPQRLNKMNPDLSALCP